MNQTQIKKVSPACNGGMLLLSKSRAPPDLGRSVNPIPTRGHNLPTKLLLPPPSEFSDIQTAL